MSGSNTGNGSVTIDPPSAIPSAAFGFSGSEQFYTVPANTSEIYFRIYGAGGGTNGDIVYGRLPVTAGQVLQLNIGGRGYGNTMWFPSHVNGEGGWNGGGNGYYGPGWGGGSGGGGASDVRKGADDLAHRKLVAGGGGGSAATTANGPNLNSVSDQPVTPDPFVTVPSSSPRGVCGRSWTAPPACPWSGIRRC